MKEKLPIALAVAVGLAAATNTEAQTTTRAVDEKGNPIEIKIGSGRKFNDPLVYELPNTEPDPIVKEVNEAQRDLRERQKRLAEYEKTRERKLAVDGKTIDTSKYKLTPERNSNSTKPKGGGGVQHRTQKR